MRAGSRPTRDDFVRFFIMSAPRTSIRLVPAVLAVLVALAVIAWQQARISRLSRDLEMSRVSIANLTRQAAATASEAKDDGETPMTLEDLAVLRGGGGGTASREPASAVPPTAGTSEGAPVAGEDHPLARLGDVLANPESRSVIQAQLLDRTRTDYDALFARLGLDDAKREAVVDLVVQRQLAELEAAASLVTADASDQDFRAKVRAEADGIGASLDEQIRDLVGVDAFTAIDVFRAAAVERRELDALRAAGASEVGNDPGAGAIGADE